MNRAVIACVMLMVSAVANAELNYSYAEAAGISGTVDNSPSDIDIKGGEVGGSIAVAKNFAVLPYFSWSSADLGTADLEAHAWGIDLVLHKELAAGLEGELIAGAAALKAQIGAINYNETDTGTRGGIGARYAAGDRVELFAKLLAVNAYDASDNALIGGALAKLVDHLQLGAAYTAQEDAREIDIRLRYTF